MAKSGNERITVRLSSGDMAGLKKIQASGDFEEMGAAVRWCLHFTVAVLKVLPAAIAVSFVESEEAEKEVKTDDTLEVAPEQPFCEKG